MQIIVNNLAVTYELAGKGKTVVLLHGWGDNYHTFDQLVSDLKNDYQVLAFDLPGFGSSQAPPKAWDLDNYAVLTAALQDKLELKAYALIGHSNGGALAICGLSSGILKSDKLVLLASAGIRNSQPVKRLATKVVAKVGKMSTYWLPSETRQNLRRKLYGTVGSDMLVMPELSETFKRTVAQDVQADAARLKLPTLIINADQDPAIALSDGKLYHSLIKGSRLEVLHSNSHFIHQENFAQVAKIIKSFL
ncbi:MAG: alpha/beta fold hydrolase [Candidatus Saccharimonadales bacterium]